MKLLFISSLLEDLGPLFTLTHSILETGVRATTVYFVLLLILRFLPKRNVGSIAPHDVLILVILGGLATDGIMGGADTLADFLLMALFIAAWTVCIDWLDYHCPFLNRLFRERRVILVRQGIILADNLRREMITEEELRSNLRLEGIDDLSVIEVASLEVGGRISVLRRTDSDSSSSQ